MKAVFDTRPGSNYEDDLQTRCQFPARYLRIVEACVGDWVVYRQPKKGGGHMGYFAAARVTSVEEDPNRAGHFFMHVADYIEFDPIVPLRLNGLYLETDLRGLDARNVGIRVRGRSVRALQDEEFAAIVSFGLQGNGKLPGNEGPAEQSEEDQDLETLERARVLAVVHQIQRDSRFSREVRGAYGYCCAFTGLGISDHNGLHEVVAAHIKPVADNGPDYVSNGIALSATIHWLFDHHLITVDEEYRIIASEAVPGPIRAVLRDEMWLPRNRRSWPNKAFLRAHRKRFLRANGLV